MIKVNNMNNVYKQSFKGREDSEKVFQDKIEKLYTEAERAVPEYGSFSALRIKLKNYDKKLDVKDVVLSIKPSILIDERPKERELEIAVKSYNELHNYSVVLGRAEKDEILDLLQDETLPEKIDDFIQKAAEKFSDLE